jgi:hypothetical protein
MKKQNIFSLICLAILFTGLILTKFTPVAPIVFLLGLLLFIISTSISKTIPIHYKLPLIFLSMTLTGICFKLMHWPGGNFMLLFGSILLAFSLIIHLIIRLTKINYKAQPYIDIIVSVFFIYFIVFALFKILHWPSISYPSFLSPLYILAIWIIQLAYEIFIFKKEVFAKLITVLMVTAYSFGGIYLVTNNISNSILDAFKIQDEQGLAQNSSIIRSINGIEAKIAMLKLDEQAKKTAIETEPTFNEIVHYSNQVDDYFLAELNTIINFSEEEKDWFIKDASTQITSYRNFEELKNPGDYNIPAWFFGGEAGSISFYRGEELRKMLIEYRNDIIIYFYNSNEKHTTDLTPEKLDNLNNFETFLKDKECTNSNKLIHIYKRLTKPKYIIQNGEKKPWNVARFHYQPVVGTIGAFTSLRNDIRLSQLDVSKMLLERIDKPMMIDIKTINADGEIPKVKYTIAAYDSTKTYTIKETK